MLISLKPTVDSINMSTVNHMIEDWLEGLHIRLDYFKYLLQDMNKNYLFISQLKNSKKLVNKMKLLSNILW